MAQPLRARAHGAGGRRQGRARARWSSSAQRLFRELPTPPADDRAAGRATTAASAREERDLEQAHLLLGLPAFSYLDDDFYALQVLSTMLGGGMSSRLFQEVRENRGLAYSIFSFASSYADTGLFGIYAGTGEQETAELIPVVCDEFHEADRPSPARRSWCAPARSSRRA